MMSVTSSVIKNIAMCAPASRQQENAHKSLYVNFTTPRKKSHPRQADQVSTQTVVGADISTPVLAVTERQGKFLQTKKRDKAAACFLWWGFRRLHDPWRCCQRRCYSGWCFRRCTDDGIELRIFQFAGWWPHALINPVRAMRTASLTANGTGLGNFRAIKVQLEFPMHCFGLWDQLKFHSWEGTEVCPCKLIRSPNQAAQGFGIFDCCTILSGLHKVRTDIFFCPFFTCYFDSSLSPILYRLHMLWAGSESNSLYYLCSNVFYRVECKKNDLMHMLWEVHFGPVCLVQLFT